MIRQTITNQFIQMLLRGEIQLRGNGEDTVPTMRLKCALYRNPPESLAQLGSATRAYEPANELPAIDGGTYETGGYDIGIPWIQGEDHGFAIHPAQPLVLQPGLTSTTALGVGLGDGVRIDGGLLYFPDLDNAAMAVINFGRGLQRISTTTTVRWFDGDGNALLRISAGAWLDNMDIR